MGTGVVAAAILVALVVLAPAHAAHGPATSARAASAGLSLIVQTSAGQPVVGAEVVLSSYDNRERWVLSSGAEGYAHEPWPQEVEGRMPTDWRFVEVKSPLGSGEISSVSGDVILSRAHGFCVRPPRGSASAAITIRIAVPGAPIWKGKVRTASGAGVAGAELLFTQHSFPGGRLTGKTSILPVSRQPRSGETAHSDSQGDFRIDLQPGQWRLASVKIPQEPYLFAADAAQPQMLRPEQTFQQDVVMRLGGRVRVQIVDHQGTPARETEVVVFSRGAGTVVIAAVGMADAKGSWRSAALAAQDYEISVGVAAWKAQHHDTHASARVFPSSPVSVTAGQDVEITVALPPPLPTPPPFQPVGSGNPPDPVPDLVTGFGPGPAKSSSEPSATAALSGRVVDVAGRPVGFAMLSVDGEQLRESSNADGSFAITIPAEGATIAAHSGAGWSQSDPVRLMPGKDHVLRVVHRPVTWRGQLKRIDKSAASDTPASGRTLVWRGQRAVSDAQGFFAFTATGPCCARLSVELSQDEQLAWAEEAWIDLRRRPDDGETVSVPALVPGIVVQGILSGLAPAERAAFRMHGTLLLSDKPTTSLDTIAEGIQLSTSRFGTGSCSVQGDRYTLRVPAHLRKILGRVTAQIGLWTPPDGKIPASVLIPLPHQRAQLVDFDIDLSEPRRLRLSTQAGTTPIAALLSLSAIARFDVLDSDLFTFPAPPEPLLLTDLRRDAYYLIDAHDAGGMKPLGATPQALPIERVPTLIMPVLAPLVPSATSSIQATGLMITVVDSEGRPVPNAPVRWRDNLANAKQIARFPDWFNRSVPTGADGKAVLALPAGSYAVQATLSQQPDWHSRPLCDSDIVDAVVRDRAVELKLVAPIGGLVELRVLDDQGKPIEWLSAAAYRTKPGAPDRPFVPYHAPPGGLGYARCVDRHRDPRVLLGPLPSGTYDLFVKSTNQAEDNALARVMSSKSMPRVTVIVGAASAAFPRVDMAIGPITDADRTTPIPPPPPLKPPGPPHPVKPPVTPPVAPGSATSPVDVF